MARGQDTSNEGLTALPLPCGGRGTGQTVRSGAGAGQADMASGMTSAVSLWPRRLALGVTLSTELPFWVLKQPWFKSLTYPWAQDGVWESLPGCTHHPGEGASKLQGGRVLPVAGPLGESVWAVGGWARPSFWPAPRAGGRRAPRSENARGGAEGAWLLRSEICGCHGGPAPHTGPGALRRGSSAIPPAMPSGGSANAQGVLILHTLPSAGGVTDTSQNTESGGQGFQAQVRPPAGCRRGRRRPMSSRSCNWGATCAPGGGTFRSFQ